MSTTIESSKYLYKNAPAYYGALDLALDLALALALAVIRKH
jgi:hypothetical protein